MNSQIKRENNLKFYVKHNGHMVCVDTMINCTRTGHRFTPLTIVDDLIAACLADNPIRQSLGIPSQSGPLKLYVSETETQPLEVHIPLSELNVGHAADSAQP
jgi:hypothetical protein